MSLREIGWIGIGSAIVCSGMSLVGVYAFRGQLLLVISGFGLFVIGYRIMQYGTYEWPNRNFVAIQYQYSAPLVKKGFGVSLSVVLAAYGFVLMGQAVQTQKITPMIMSGISVVVGYMIGHQTVNDEIL